MTMNVCSVANIRARLLSRAWVPAWLAIAGVTITGVTGFAAENSVNRLGRGITAWDLHDYSSATQSLRGLQVPKVPDYGAYYLGYAELLSGSPEAAVRTLDAYRTKPAQSSPLAGRIDVVHARALINLKQPATLAKAIEILKSALTLPHPEGVYILGTAYEATGDRLNALFCYRKAFYGYPGNGFSAQSQIGLDRLRAAMGANYPEATPAEQLERTRHLLDLRDYRTARAEYSSLASSLPDQARDEARVGLGATQFLTGDPAGAFTYLKTLRLNNAEEDARRLYYLVEAARKLNDDDEMLAAIRQLNERRTTSPWRLKALLAAGNRFITSNDTTQYTPLFRAASQDFAADPATAAPHWKLAWDAYVNGRPERVALMKEQLARYPRDSRASAALYYLGRAAWSVGQYAEARTWFERNSAQFPHYYYAVLSRERLAEPKLANAKLDITTAEWLNSLEWGRPRDFSTVTANSATQTRVERARILMAAGLADLADAELRFGAKNDNEQAHLLAIELARSMPSPFNALRIMKSFSSDYLAVPFESAPLTFWQMLFPLPYKSDIEQASVAKGLDPFSVAGLIRQETEFNPAAASGKKALGLMQLVLPTGREMGRREGIPIPGMRTLFDPAVNIRLGTAYLKQQLGRWDNDWTQTLAAYNAGPGRVRQWLSWGQTYHEPAEFVESIPFNETRDYVQAVLRNADAYRYIYGQKHPNLADVRDNYDTPPVYLTSLPKAARTPGGGMQAAPARPATKPGVTTRKAAPAPAKRPAIQGKKKTPPAKRPAA